MVVRVRPGGLVRGAVHEGMNCYRLLKEQTGLILLWLGLLAPLLHLIEDFDQHHVKVSGAKFLDSRMLNQPREGSRRAIKFL